MTSVGLFHYHDPMTTDSNCPMCQSVAELGQAAPANLVWQFPHSVAVLGQWQFFTGYCVLMCREPRHRAQPTRAYTHRVPRRDGLLARRSRNASAPTSSTTNCSATWSRTCTGTSSRATLDDPERLRPVWFALERAKSDPAEKRRLETGTVPPEEVVKRLRDWLDGERGTDAMSSALRLGTRGSPLALWQANHVAARLRPVIAPRRVELVTIETHGDRDQATALAAMGGFGVFTKAIQTALLEDRVDVAVHSLKDLPTIPEPGLELVAVPPRGPTGDAFVSRHTCGSTISPKGRSSAPAAFAGGRRCSTAGPIFRLVDLRGNVETRLRKLDEQNLDAIILAEAGLVRLGLADQITEILDPSWMLPAVGQGAIGLECRVRRRGHEALRGGTSRCRHLRLCNRRAGDAARARRRVSRADRRHVECRQRRLDDSRRGVVAGRQAASRGHAHRPGGYSAGGRPGTRRDASGGRGGRNPARMRDC